MTMPKETQGELAQAVERVRRDLADTPAGDMVVTSPADLRLILAALQPPADAELDALEERAREALIPSADPEADRDKLTDWLSETLDAVRSLRLANQENGK